MEDNKVLTLVQFSLRRVWHNGLLYKMKLLKFPLICIKIIQIFFDIHAIEYIVNSELEITRLSH